MTVNNFELTLAILKPHILKVPYAVQGIREIIISNKFWVVRSKEITMSNEQAELFYSEHKEKFFYNRLVTSMRSGPSQVYILARQDAISTWRKLMGPTKVFKAQYSHPESIRGKYGLTDTRNATHGSDSSISAEREIKIIFPEFDLDKWYKTEEPDFKAGNVAFDNDRFLHYIDVKKSDLY